MDISCQNHAPADLFPAPIWVDPRDDLDVEENIKVSYLYQDSNPLTLHSIACFFSGV